MDEDIVDDEMTRGPKVPQVKVWLAIVLLLVHLQGMLFKVLHWPFAEYLRLLPLGIWLGYALHYLILRKDRSIRNISSLIIVLAYISLSDMYSEELYVIGITTVVAFLLTFAWKDK